MLNSDILQITQNQLEAILDECGVSLGLRKSSGHYVADLRTKEHQRLLVYGIGGTPADAIQNAINELKDES